MIDVLCGHRLGSAFCLGVALAGLACSDASSNGTERDRERDPVTDRGPESDGGSSEDAQDASPGATPPAAFRPEPRAASDALIDQLTIPAGFALNVFGRELGHARMLAVHQARVYLTRPQQGDVLWLRDDDGDGTSEATTQVASKLMGVHGIAFHESWVYLATPTEVYRAQVASDGSFGTPQKIMADLPDGAQHPNRTLAVGPDRKLYVSVGSSCNACPETNPEHATLLRAELDGSARTVFARGLRNTIGFDWHPATGELWGMDHGSDWLGDDLPPEELNRIQAGADYGWPYCYGDRRIDPIIAEPPGGSKAAHCPTTVPPVLCVQAHGAPIGMVFYRATSFPLEYRNDAFIALRGSWNRSVPTGYKVVRLRFDQSGQALAFEDFVTGFLIEEGTAEFGRLAGIAVAADGALLFTDDENGVVYRVQAAP